ncbi:hypothetical protein ACFDR9_000071 [Janthinobacterium sp. CG_23.3]|uniref:hypothetical protein n=1 Tax=Janthinobacterium sp. CG_23.3 TaxID=3349634 RepID=UPI0038D36D77
MPGTWRRWLLAASLNVATAAALAQGVSDCGLRQGLPEGLTGVQTRPFLCLGAKHMVTGYDHLLLRRGVIFFLYRTRDISSKNRHENGYGGEATKFVAFRGE